jgi:magnesium chelatase family protein
LSKVSGRLLDRFEIHLEVLALQYKDLRGGVIAEGSEQIGERVLAARERQHARFGAAGERTGCNGNGSSKVASRQDFSNAQMKTQKIRAECELDMDADRFWSEQSTSRVERPGT